MQNKLEKETFITFNIEYFRCKVHVEPMRCIDMHYIDKNKVTCLRKQCQNLVHMYTVRMQYLVNNVAKGGKHSPLNYNEFSLLCYLNPNLMFFFFFTVFF